jgi:HK97 family phage major capsid protein/HK97 family phage prohead protease
MNEKFLLRAYQTDKDPWTFVASTDAIDRYGDVIDPKGWDLRHFKKNPIALWNHNHSQPIGNWEDVRVEDGKLIARLKMIKAGVSSIADMIRDMIENRVLRATSVGFQPKGKPERILDSAGNWTGGYKFLKSELLEISVVSVPANPEALAIARTFGVSRAGEKLLFCESAEDAEAVNAARRRGLSAQFANNQPNGNTTMQTLAQRIEAKEAEAATLRDQITELSAVEEPTDEQTVQLEERTIQLEAVTKSLGTLRNAQTALAASAAPAGASRGTGDESGSPARPAQIRSRGAADPGALMIRAALVHLRSFLDRRDPATIIRSNFGGAADLEMMVRATVDPAMTGVQGWAAELVGETVGGFVDQLRPTSVFFNMPMGTFTFGRGKIKLPSRNGGSLAGSFVAEGAPIPVRKLGLASAVLEPHKLGVISTFTREIAMMSDPQIEPLLRDAMVADTRETLDTIFLDNNVAVPGLRPAGLQKLADTNTVASSGTTLANIVTDLRAAVTAMTNADMGTNLVWIMNKQRALSLSLVTNAAGAFMFRDELANGTLLGIPVVTSTKVPAAVIFLTDAAELAAAYDSVPQIDVSEQATLHMEDTTPLPIVDNATQAVTAHPVRSLWQTATVGVRLLWDLTWTQRRPGAVFTITGVQW